MKLEDAVQILAGDWQNKYAPQLAKMDRFRKSLEAFASVNGIDTESSEPEIDAYGITISIKTPTCSEWGIRLFFEDGSILLVGGPVGFWDQPIGNRAMDEFVEYSLTEDDRDFRREVIERTMRSL